MSVMRRASPEMMRVLKVMRGEMGAHAGRRGDRLEVKYLSGWIAFRSAAANRAFAEVRPGKRGIEMFLLPPRAELRDSHGIAMPVPPSRGWGWFRTRVKMEDGLSPMVAVDLLRQSYEYARRMRGKRAARRK
jgi:predicted transport protein